MQSEKSKFEFVDLSPRTDAVSYIEELTVIDHMSKLYAEKD